MTRMIRDRWRRLGRTTAGCLLGSTLLAPPLGPTTTQQAVEQMNRMSTRPLPSADPRPVVRDDKVWVPDRYVRVPGSADTMRVPGHWERITPEGRHEVPPITAVEPSTGAVRSFPTGEYPPPEQRPYGP